MTTPDTNRILADFVGHGGNLPFSPPTNRNDLAEVLGRLTREQWETVMHALRDTLPPMDTPGWGFWLLTCDPAIIAGAVARVVQNG